MASDVGFYIGIVILAWLLFDIIIFIVNGLNNTGPGGCATDNWITLSILTPINSFLVDKDKCSDTDDNDNDGYCKDLGPQWRAYKVNNDDGHKNSLCKNEIDRLYKDIVNNNIVAGYNSTELLAYIIVPFVTISGIIWGLISTRLSKGEWTFWILIATLIFTSISSIAYDSDLSIAPETTSPLTYITDKLNMSGTDELKYSFIARKNDGQECLVDGVMFGSGITPEGNKPQYSGFCDSSSLPLT